LEQAFAEALAPTPRFIRAWSPRFDLLESGRDDRHFVVEMSDVLQYISGKTLGRHKIIPEVSPNKTWEGFLGGIATAMLLSLGIRFLTPFSIVETLLVSLLITVAGFFGGAVMSAVKRDFGVKDFGSVIPGHGGMLDRVDSLCYAAPIFFHYVRYFYTN
jgi:phosphatidate cytidylyltransferase